MSELSRHKAYVVNFRHVVHTANNSIYNSTKNKYHIWIKSKHKKTLRLIFDRPTSANIKWKDIESLFIALGAEVGEREGSRIGVRLFNDRRVFHRPHPEPTTDKGAVASIREWLRTNGVQP